LCFDIIRGSWQFGVESASLFSWWNSAGVALPDQLKVLLTIRDFIRWGASEFLRNHLSFGHGFPTAIDESRYLVLHALALPWDWPESYFDCQLTDSEKQAIFDILIVRVNSRQPAAYITHEAWFCGLSFYVDHRVLIPRSPIAELIGNQFQPWVDPDNVNRILDLCTGSGCIAIASQYQFFDADISASDISRDALEVARLNLQKHDLHEHITLYESDGFKSIPPQEFDLIISNPPYVDAEDMDLLTTEFTFEPIIGLASGDDGLKFVGQMLKSVGSYLSDHGSLIVEVGNSQQAMMQKYEFLPMTWIDFELGGAGVCVISGEDIRNCQPDINNI
jgi:ribosomal protein L3 glutamine methyltransferase